MTTRGALYGFVLITIALGFYVSGLVLSPIRWLLGDPPMFREFHEALVWYSGVPLFLGSLMLAWDLARNVNKIRDLKSVRNDPVENTGLTVALSAYNDEKSIGDAVRDFASHPLVKRVIVVSNNSTDKTMEVAREAGAIVFNEEHQGYGACIRRAMQEALKHDDTELTVLCEGDSTFRAFDIDKLMAYIQHCDIVNGSRIVERLQDRHTQLTLYMHYGNFFAGKLLELKHLGRVSLSDLGTTYKLCRNEPLRRLMGELNPRINLEFNPYFLDSALRHGLHIIECPISFHPRVGASKGGNVNNRIATRLGLRMIWGILFDWWGIPEPASKDANAGGDSDGS